MEALNELRMRVFNAALNSLARENEEMKKRIEALEKKVGFTIEEETKTEREKELLTSLFGVAPEVVERNGVKMFSFNDSDVLRAKAKDVLSATAKKADECGCPLCENMRARERNLQAEEIALKKSKEEK